MRKGTLNAALVGALGLASAGIAAQGRAAVKSFAQGLADMRGTDQLGNTGRAGGPRYTNNRGHSVAEGKRRADKRRRQLRGKGHYRQAAR